VIYLIGLFTVIATLLARAEKHLSRGVATTAKWIILAVFCVIALHEYPMTTLRPLNLRSRIDDVDLSRAASRRIVGPAALVGSAGAGVWYASGASHLYPMHGDILTVASVAGIDLKQYFGRFDAVVIDPNQSWVTMNQERMTITSEYVKGTLALKGFYFGKKNLPELTMMMLATKSGDPIQGYADGGPKVLRFRAAPSGDWLYYSAVCPKSDSERAAQLPYAATFYLPTKDSGISGAPPDGPVIETMLVPKAEFKSKIEPTLRVCRVRESVAGEISQVDRTELLDERRTDAGVAIYRSLPGALAMSGHIRPDRMAVTQRVDLAGTRASTGHAMTGGGVRFRISPRLWEDSATLPVELDANANEEYVYIEGGVRGRVGVSLRRGNSMASEYYWVEKDGVTALALPVPASGADQLVFRNIKADEFGEVVLKRAMVLVPPTAAQASSRRDAAALARAHTCVPAPLCGTAPAPTLQALPGVAGGASTPSENAARVR
ncbi:MAG TPA: hypothetical protein VKE70_07780, partial [Candidatus Solibacter sp.]|nr:hypothetical protein [Candidatus Solibacter sp.]